MNGKIVYQLVGPLHLSVGPEEVARRQAFLQSHAAPGVEVEARPLPEGRAAIESDTDSALAGPHILESVIRAEAEGARGVIIGCFGDPVIEAARECVSVPLIGAGEAAMALALQLGYRFSIISPIGGGRGRRDAQVRLLGLESRYASTRGLGVDIAGMTQGAFDPLPAIIAAGRRCIEEDGAEVLVLGCMSFAFLDLTAEIQEAVGAPVVNPVIAALKSAETMLAHGLRHSRVAWPAAKSKTHYV